MSCGARAAHRRSTHLPTDRASSQQAQGPRLHSMSSLLQTLAQPQRGLHTQLGACSSSRSSVAVARPHAARRPLQQQRGATTVVASATTEAGVAAAKASVAAAAGGRLPAVWLGL